MKSQQSVLFSQETRADITRCVVDINLQSGLTVYLPTGHRVFTSTHVMFVLRGKAENLCMAAELAHHLKMMSEPECCPAVHIPYSHTFYFRSFPLCFFSLCSSLSNNNPCDLYADNNYSCKTYNYFRTCTECPHFHCLWGYFLKHLLI